MREVTPAIEKGSTSGSIWANVEEGAIDVSAVGVSARNTAI